MRPVVVLPLRDDKAPQRSAPGDLAPRCGAAMVRPLLAMASGSPRRGLWQLNAQAHGALGDLCPHVADLRAPKAQRRAQAGQTHAIERAHLQAEATRLRGVDLARKAHIAQLHDEAQPDLPARQAWSPQPARPVERARFLHHDGGDEDKPQRLDHTLAAANLVICQAGSEPARPAPGLDPASLCRRGARPAQRRACRPTRCVAWRGLSGLPRAEHRSEPMRRRASHPPCAPSDRQRRAWLAAVPTPTLGAGLLSDRAVVGQGPATASPMPLAAPLLQWGEVHDHPRRLAACDALVAALAGRGWPATALRDATSACRKGWTPR